MSGTDGRSRVPLKVTSQGEHCPESPLFHPLQSQEGSGGNGPRDDEERDVFRRSDNSGQFIDSTCATVDDGEEVCASGEHCDCRCKRLLAQDPATGDAATDEATPCTGDASGVRITSALPAPELARFFATAC